MTHRLKNINNNVIINNSDSGEEVEDESCFIKGGTLTALWSSIGCYAETCWTCKQEHGWWNVVVMKGNRKRVELMNMRRMSDSKSSGINSCKSQCERAIGNAKELGKSEKYSCKHK